MNSSVSRRELFFGILIVFSSDRHLASIDNSMSTIATVLAGGAGTPPLSSVIPWRVLSLRKLLLQREKAVKARSMPEEEDDAEEKVEIVQVRTRKIDCRLYDARPAMYTRSVHVERLIVILVRISRATGRRAAGRG